MTMAALLNGLNERQREAVTSPLGNMLVLAGAGSGKTKVLTHRVAYFVQKDLIQPENALLLTFTNKAANEMKERILKLTNGNAPLAATYHSFSAKVLRIDGINIGTPPGFITNRIKKIWSNKSWRGSISQPINITPKQFSIS